MEVCLSFTRSFSSRLIRLCFSENLYLSPVSAVVQLRPQLHHLDAAEDLTKARAARAKRDGDEEAAPRDAEARVIDVKVKSAEGGEAIVAGNIELLKKMQDEKWESYEWVDAEVRDKKIPTAVRTDRC